MKRTWYDKALARIIGVVGSPYTTGALLLLVLVLAAFNAAHAC